MESTNTDNITIDSEAVGESSDEEIITAKQVIEILQEAWVNEKFAPEILPHKSDMVECMLGQIQHMEENMKKLKKNDIRLIVHQMEIERIRFLITDYLRTRLEKIETYTKSIIDAEALRVDEDSKYLSVGEHKFALEFLSNLEELFKKSGISSVPGNWRELDWNEMSILPNLHSYVFLKAKKDIAGIVLDASDVDNDVVNLEENSQFIMPYDCVSQFVKDGAIKLI